MALNYSGLNYHTGKFLSNSGALLKTSMKSAIIESINTYSSCTARCAAGSFDVLSTVAPKHITSPAPDVGRTRRMTLSYEFPGYGTPGLDERIECLEIMPGQRLAELRPDLSAAAVQQRELHRHASPRSG